MREELDALIGVGWGESSLDRKGYRNGYYTRDLNGYLAVYMCIFPKIHLAHTSASQQARQAKASKLHSLEQHASILNSCNMGGDVEYSGNISQLLGERIEVII